MAKFYCKKCNYRFESNSENLPMLCPYCGEKGVIKKEESAEQMVE